MVLSCVHASRGCLLFSEQHQLLPELHLFVREQTTSPRITSISSTIAPTSRPASTSPRTLYLLHPELRLLLPDRYFSQTYINTSGRTTLTYNRITSTTPRITSKRLQALHLLVSELYLLLPELHLLLSELHLFFFKN